MKRLIECVPNFSEGRDLAKVDAIVAAMREVPGVFLLDRESDADHNRSVVTLAGEPEAVAEAALRGVGKAAELIDLTKHTGAHPRMGATDVVPFIPIEGVAIEDCVALAKKVGREIWERYRIPVYFYEAAAQRPERTNLENIRKGQFEGLREEVPRNPDRAPDIGEPRLASDGRRNRRWRAKIPDRLQHQSEYAGPGNREENRQEHPFLERRLALREGHGRGSPRAQSGAGLHQHDGFRADAHASRVRNGEARSGALWRLNRGQRNRRPDSETRHRTNRRLLPAARKLFRRASVRESYRGIARR